MEKYTDAKRGARTPGGSFYEGDKVRLCPVGHRKFAKRLGVHMFLVMEMTRNASHLTAFLCTPSTPAENNAHYTHTHTTRTKHDVLKPVGCVCIVGATLSMLFLKMFVFISKLYCVLLF